VTDPLASKPGAPLRRNDPCPCGSGRRYKECHGALANEAPPSIDTRVQRALQLHQQGRIDEAAAGYRAILEAEPGNAIATHYLGMIAWSRGDVADAEQKMRASIAANATVPDFHNNLALLHGSLGQREAAIAGFRRALEVDPAWYEAHNNLGLALEDASRWEEAEAQYRAALARAPGFAAAHQNLARLLLLLGRFTEAWNHYRWRLVARGMSATAPDAGAAPLPQSLAGRRFALVAEQGLGDVLFFLRFAPELARRGAQLAFRGDARLHAMLARTGHFALGIGTEKDATAGMEVVFVGDLPWLAGAGDPASFPPALPLNALPERIAAMRERLAAAGPAPYIALTWRAGVAAVGPARSQVKEAPAQALAAALAGKKATWISVQRRPEPGTREALEIALGAGVHDFSAANEDLEDMLALMALVDDYAGPSNANTHLRAGLGRSQLVFLPDPPEWRWMASGERSPWFPDMRLRRS
jgi:tetratricopeptide (TPR) repeat protein